jgi:N-acetylglucosamine-6-phosphate deacetylase
MSEILFAIAAAHLFDGVTVHEGAAALIEGARIAGVVPRAEIPKTAVLCELPDGTWIAPGFIDIQVNGGGDVLLNDAPTPDIVRKILAAHRNFGTTALLPTLISDTPEKMQAAITTIAELAVTEPGVLGIHLEGPFLSPGKAGVHDRRALRRPTPDDLAVISAPRAGVTLVTLAPEEVPAGFVGQLVSAGVRVSLGHSLATYEQTRAAIAAGLTGFTHLFNAMRPLQSREPGPIAAALESQSCWYSLIIDGIHVAPSMLRLALRGAGRPMLITDAMPPVGGEQPSFNLNGETVVVQDGHCASKDGRLAGAYLDMAGAVRNCVRLLQVPLVQALRFASTNPAEFLGLGNRLGRIAAGYRADLVAFNGDTLDVIDTWVAGRSTSGRSFDPNLKFAAAKQDEIL